MRSRLGPRLESVIELGDGLVFCSVNLNIDLCPRFLFNFVDSICHATSAELSNNPHDTSLQPDSRNGESDYQTPPDSSRWSYVLGLCVTTSARFVHGTFHKVL